MDKSFIKETLKLKFTQNIFTKCTEDSTTITEFTECIHHCLISNISMNHMQEDLLGKYLEIKNDFDSSSDLDEQTVKPSDLSRYDIFLCFTHNKKFRSKITNHLNLRGYTVALPHFLFDETKCRINKTGTCIIAIINKRDENSSHLTKQLQYTFKCQLPIVFITTELDFIPTVNWLKLIMNNGVTPIVFTLSDFDQLFGLLLQIIQSISDGLISSVHQEVKSMDNLDKDRSDRFIGYLVEWTVVFRNPAFKANQFRQQLNNPTYILSNNALHNIFQHYHLILSNKIEKDLRKAFFQAVEDNDARYLIYLYTDTTGFSRCLNEHLATYGLHYFDDDLQENVNYQLIKCLMDFISMLYYRPEFDADIFKGEVYRGMHFSEESDLYKYVVQSHIMNTTFLSTSKNKSIAEVFATREDKSTKNCSKLSVLCTYVIVNERTALNIENLSKFPVEEEVIIMPFSAFRVEKVERNGLSSSNIEITLVQCPQINGDNTDETLSSLLYNVRT